MPFSVMHRGPPAEFLKIVLQTDAPRVIRDKLHPTLPCFQLRPVVSGEYKNERTNDTVNLHFLINIIEIYMSHQSLHHQIG